MYAVESDVSQTIGRLPIASGISVQSFIDDAYAQMNTYFIGIYEIPITIKSETTAITSGIVTNILKSIEKELAGGKLLLSLDTTSENDNIHSYGEYLVGEAEKKLQNIRDQILILPGVEQETDISEGTVKPSRLRVSSPYSASYFNRPYNQVGNVYIDGGV